MSDCVVAARAVTLAAWFSCSGALAHAEDITASRFQLPQVQVDSAVVRLPVIEGRDLRFTRLLRNQGLSQQRVTSITQDHRGFLWFATDYGVDRYDGYRFRPFASEPGVYVEESSLFVDRSGTLWVGSDYALDRYDAATESFSHYPLAAPSALGSLVHHITQDRAGMLWVSTGAGLYRLDLTHGGTTLFRHNDVDPLSLSSDDIRSSGEDRQGTFWVATSQGLDAFDREHGRVTLHVPLQGTRDLGFYEDRDGVFWVHYASGNGLAVFDRVTRRLTRYSFGRENLASHPLTGVSAMLEDQEGTLWIGTLSDGLLKYDRAQQRFIRYHNDPSNDESLTENRIATMLQDREKNIWIGFAASDPAFFSTRRSSFEVLPSDSRNPDNLGQTLVNGIYEDREGIVWMGTTGALVRLDRKSGQFSHITVPGDGLASDVVCTVEDALGALWIGTDGQGLYRREPGGRRLTVFRHSDSDPKSLSDDTVIRLLVDHAGTLWVGTQNGLDRFNPDTRNFTTFRPTGEAETDMVRDLAEDSTGALWVGSGFAGVLQFDPRSGSFSPLGRARQPSELLWLNSVLVDRVGSIWVGTQTGLTHFDPQSGWLGHYTDRDGLPNNAVYCVLEDSSGGLWMGTAAGISHLDPRRKVFTNYTTADGLPGLDFTGWRACFRSKSGELFIGGFSGAVAFRPESLATAATYSPPVALTAFQLFGRPVTLGSGSLLKRVIDYTDQLTLTHDQNSFAFEFAALSFTNPATNRYRYRLDGLEQNWHEVGSDQRYASYTTLPAGTYRFRVQGATTRGPWGEPGVAVRVDIKSAWWATFWFRGFLVLLLVAAALAFYLARVRQIARDFAIRLEERVGERTRIARELHDSLLQGVQGLMIRLHAVRELLPNRPADAALALKAALRSGDQAIAEGRAAVQDLRSTSLGASDLPEALTALGAEFLPDGAKLPSYRVVVEGKRRPLALLVRDDCYRIAREAVRNAVQHARARHIEVEFVYGEKCFTVLVRDDGVGIDSQTPKLAQRTGHWGLQGMRERAEGFGGHLDVWSEHGAGTEVLLEIPAALAYERAFVRTSLTAQPPEQP